jgi:hypothetical protein
MALRTGLNDVAVKVGVELQHRAAVVQGYFASNELNHRAY